MGLGDSLGAQPLKGTTAKLVLEILAERDAHGYDIAQRSGH
jgi:DNA-binding PadR family transcriptional regulator